MGKGTFATVYMCTVASTGDIVAVKKLKQHKKFKSRELSIAKEMHHSNIVRVRHAYFTPGQTIEETILNIIMDYIPTNVYRI